jgi:hypothetical protein
VTASSILTSMASSGSVELKSTTSHLYLQMGHLQLADRLINQVEADKQASPWLKRLNAALRALCYGDLDLAVECFNQTLELEPDNIVVRLLWNSRAVIAHNISGFEQPLSRVT